MITEFEKAAIQVLRSHGWGLQIRDMEYKGEKTKDAVYILVSQATPTTLPKNECSIRLDGEWYTFDDLRTLIARANVNG